MIIVIIPHSKKQKYMYNSRHIKLRKILLYFWICYTMHVPYHRCARIPRCTVSVFFVRSQIFHVTVSIGRQSVGGPGTSQAVKSKQKRRSINYLQFWTKIGIKLDGLFLAYLTHFPVSICMEKYAGLISCFEGHQILRRRPNKPQQK